MTDPAYDARLVWQERLNAVRLSPATRLLASTLARLVSATGRGMVSVGELVDRTRLHKATVQRGLRHLQDLRWLRQVERGGFSYGYVRISVWQLDSPEPWPVDNSMKVATGDVHRGGSTSQPATFTPGSTSQPATFTSMKVATRDHSRSQPATLPLGSKDEDKESSSLGVSLTSADGASLAVAPSAGVVVSPDDAAAVLAAIPEVLRGRNTAENDDQRYLVMERLANGCTVVQLVEDGLRAAERAQRQVLGRGQELRNPVGWWAEYVRRQPAPPQLSDVPWCGDCDREGEHSASGRWRELDDGRFVRCWVCHPQEVLARQQQVAQLDRLVAAG